MPRYLDQYTMLVRSLKTSLQGPVQLAYIAQSRFYRCVYIRDIVKSQLCEICAFMQSLPKSKPILKYQKNHIKSCHRG